MAAPHPPRHRLQGQAGAQPPVPVLDAVVFDQREEVEEAARALHVEAVDRVGAIGGLDPNDLAEAGRGRVGARQGDRAAGFRPGDPQPAARGRRQRHVLRGAGRDPDHAGARGPNPPQRRLLLAGGAAQVGDVDAGGADAAGYPDALGRDGGRQPGAGHLLHRDRAGDLQAFARAGLGDHRGAGDGVDADVRVVDAAGGAEGNVGGGGIEPVVGGGAGRAPDREQFARAGQRRRDPGGGVDRETAAGVGDGGRRRPGGAARRGGLGGHDAVVGLAGEDAREDGAQAAAGAGEEVDARVDRAQLGSVGEDEVGTGHVLAVGGDRAVQDLVLARPAFPGPEHVQDAVGGALQTDLAEVPHLPHRGHLRPAGGRGAGERAAERGHGDEREDGADQGPTSSSHTRIQTEARSASKSPIDQMSAFGSVLSAC